MAWVRRDDQASIHRKVRRLDDAAYRLWSEALEWCARNLTDGVILAEDLEDVSVRGELVHAASLVGRDLWHTADHRCGSEHCPKPGPDGWVVHDYLAYNPSKAQTQAQRAKTAERQKRWRDKQTGAYVTPLRDASVTPLVTPAPSRPVPSPKDGTGKGVRPVSGSGRPLPGGAGGVAPSNAPQCHDCGNRTDSAYHRNTCLRGRRNA